MRDWENAKYRIIDLAKADDGNYSACVSLSAVQINAYPTLNLFKIYCVCYYDETNGKTEEYFGDLRSACAAFGKEARRKYIKPEGEFIYGPVSWAKDWKHFRRELIPDDGDRTSSSSHGDYSPSAPWNAPGMSVHDFI